MQGRIRWVILCFLALCHATAGVAAPPQTFLLSGDRLSELRQRIGQEDPALRDAVKQLRRRADKWLTRGPWSVTEKPFTPPSGDKHDYMSVGPYWWPNPDTDDGLPYVRRDGRTNPERKKYDNVGLNRMIDAVRDLSLAWHLLRDERYAERAAQVLRVWFLDEATRMNPHLNYAQAIPGRVKGRGIGIIDAHDLPQLIDAVGLLQDADAWSDADQQALEKWFDTFLDWMLSSKHGRDEANTKNNHATWYDAQLMSYALFVGQNDKAREIARRFGPRRIATQIKPDGRMPHELKRTRSFDYTAFNLQAFVNVATLSEHVDVDVWGYTADNGTGLRGALDWWGPYVSGEKEWPHKQIKKIDRSRAIGIFRRAAIAYRQPRYERVVDRAARLDDAPPLLDLLYPEP